MQDDTPQLCILCDDPAQREDLHSELSRDARIHFSGGIADLPELPDRCIIVLDLSGAEQAAESVTLALTASNACVINQHTVTGLGKLQKISWRQKLLRQVQEIFERENASSKRTHETVPAQRIWVLCASTDGPKAIGDFLESLGPPNGESFIVLQHIKDTFVAPLREQLARRTAMKVLAGTRPEKLKPNTVYICPPSKTPGFENGRLLWEKKRSRKFSPCIDEALISLSGSLGALVSVIVFSGMGTDCLRGCVKVSELGGKVWAQDLESATVSTMPQCVIDANLCDKTGTPRDLADYLNQRVTSSKNSA